MVERRGVDSTITGGAVASSGVEGALASVASMSHASYSAGVSCRMTKMACAESGIRFRCPFEMRVIAPSALNVTVTMPFDTVSESSSVDTDTGATSAGSVAVGKAAPND